MTVLPDLNTASADMDDIHRKKYADIMELSKFRLGFIEGMYYAFRIVRMKEAADGVDAGHHHNDIARG